jgi:hypothetical protein
MFIDIIKESFFSSVHTILNIAFIVIPLMIILRITKEYNILNKFVNYFKKFPEKLFMSKEATFPLLVGLVFGISYGAGVIIQSAKDLNLNKNDLILLNTFLGICHAVFEDTLLFVAIGANGWILVSSRFLMAVIITYLFGKWLYRKDYNIKNIINSKN